jgi:hypothetical protein
VKEMKSVIKMVSVFIVIMLCLTTFSNTCFEKRGYLAASTLKNEYWKTNKVLGQNGKYGFAGIYEFNNLTIGDNVEVTSKGISQLVLKVKGTLTLGKNAVIRVRNGYYPEAPTNKIQVINKSNLNKLGVVINGVRVYPNTFGKGGDGQNGIDGQYGSVDQFGNESGDGGCGGGGGYGGGVLTIIASSIKYGSKNPPKFLASGQKGGHNGEGGLLIINSKNYKFSINQCNLNKTTFGKHIVPSVNGGHGIVTGNPQKVFINGNEIVVTNPKDNLSNGKDNGGKDTSLNNEIKWTCRNSEGTNGFSGVVWNGKQFVAVGVYVDILTSNDGIKWTKRVNETTNSLNGIIWDGKQFVVVGNKDILLSKDGVSWKSYSSGTSSPLYSIAWSGSQYAAVGWKGEILSSSNSKNWIHRNSGISDSLNAIAWGKSKFVAVGDKGDLLTSKDGVNWENGFSNAFYSLNGITWNGSQFVVVGDKGIILTSKDGTAWSPRVSGTNTTLYSITWDGQQFITVGAEGNILTSTDGVNWIKSASGTSSYLYAVTWGKNKYIAVGGRKTILSGSIINKD